MPEKLTRKRAFWNLLKIKILSKKPTAKGAL